MITRIVKMHIDKSMIGEFTKFIESAKKNVVKSEGCVNVDILNDKHNHEIFFSYSIWETEEHLEKYRNSKLFKEFWEKAHEFFTQKTQAWTVENV